MGESYDIRPYEPADRDAFLTLFEDVLGGQMGPPWFEWKYERNPYVDHVPIVVATHNGNLVGARSFFPLPVAAENDTYTAYQPCDSMVHPAHQRRGLFTRMTERAIERYDDVDLFFNFPNHRSLPGNLDLGWRVVGERETYYRVQNPAVWLSQPRPVESVARSLAGGYTALRDRLADSSATFERSWNERVPSSVLTALADSMTVSEFHVVRDETFYDWRFENPTRTYRAGVASRDGTPIAAVIYSHQERSDGSTIIRLVDVLPLSAETGTARVSALGELLDDVLRTDADLYTAPGGALPRSLLNARGFHSDARPPLGWVSTSSTHVVRPGGVEPNGWTRSGLDLTEPASWRLAACEVDSE
jgi:GNAT superfamily N-acetyltransferase